VITLKTIKEKKYSILKIKINLILKIILMEL